MYATLSISTTDVRLLSIKGHQVKKWGSMPLTSGLVRDGLIMQPTAVGEAISALFKSIKVSKKRVITSLTGLSFTYRIISLPRTKSDFIEEAIQRSAKKEMPLPLEDLYLSWQAIGGGRDELDFFVLGVPRNLIDALTQTLAEAGIKHYIIEMKPLALARVANRGDALIVALEPDCCDIVLVAGGIPAIMHTIIPRGKGASLEDNIRRLTDELSKTVKFYDSNHPESRLSPTTPLLLTGELSADVTTSKLIQDEIEYHVEPLTPPLKLPPDLPVPLYAANVGLALKKVPQKTVSKGTITRFRDINLNIPSGKYSAKTKPLSMRFILLYLVLIVFIGLLFPLYRAKSQAITETVRLQTELGRISQEFRQVRLAANEAGQIEDTVTGIADEIETLKREHQDVLSNRGDFTNSLKLVTDALPSEACFTSIEIGTDQATVAGEANSPSGVVGYVMALEAQERFSEVRIDEIDEVITETEITETENPMTENTMTQDITVGSGPTADFSFTPDLGEEPLTASFTDLSTSTDGLVSWLWNFGDGKTSTEQNPTHTYTREGIYTVSLTVKEGDGDSDIRTKTTAAESTRVSFRVIMSK